VMCSLFCPQDACKISSFSLLFINLIMRYLGI
jgi:hypothetical protein